jgi:Tol biopolymer transport system component
MVSYGNNGSNNLDASSDPKSTGPRSSVGARFAALVKGTQRKGRAWQSNRWERPAGRQLFNGIAAVLSALIVGGLFLDGWAHNHGKVDETFFTPWHAILYSAFAIYAIFLLVYAIRQNRVGYGWRHALPEGYGLSLLGAGIFAGGGILDLIWHSLFGIEADVQALVSPTHLLLAAGLFLMITGPLSAIWLRDRGTRALPWINGAPAILVLALILSVLMFFTQFAHPFVNPWAASDPRTREVHGDLYIMRADGTGQTRLTNTQHNSGTPTWSPDGHLIAFTAGDPGSMGIYVVRENGTGLKRLTTANSDSTEPAWSPNGRTIAFVASTKGSSHIMVMNADGSKPRQLASGSASEFGPAWSPDGTRIIYESNRTGNFNIYTMSADGMGQPTRLTKTSGSDDFQPAWSRDGKNIAFVATRDGEAQVYVMRADGSEQRRLTPSNTSDPRSANYSPVWSPDGRRIAFVSTRDGNGEIYVMNADGSNQVDLSNNAGMDDGAGLIAWSRDGQAIAYGSVGHAVIDSELSTALGLASILLQAGLLMGILLFALRRWMLPPGAATLIFAISAVLISFMQDEFRFIPAAILAGIVADILIVVLRPGPDHVLQLRMIALTIPAVYFLLYFVTVALTGGVAWVIHLWFGAPVMAGIFGLFLSYLAVPPNPGTDKSMARRVGESSP